MSKFLTALTVSAGLLTASAAIAQPKYAPGPIRRDAPRQALTAAAVVGQWDWFNRGVVELLADGTARGTKGEPGQWFWLDAERALVVIAWRGGWVDTLVVAPDAMRLEGRNLAGTVVSGTRRMAMPTPPQPPTPPPMPVPQPPMPPQPAEYKRPVQAGPIWSNDDARAKCPTVCQPPERWNGQWWTTVEGQMSVCECVGSNGGHHHRHHDDDDRPRTYAPPPAAPPPVVAYDDARFRAFMERLHDATFAEAKLAALRDEHNAGAHWSCQQVIAVMQELTFGDTQVQGATIMWPSVIDPQNFPSVVASLTFENDRKKLRRALGK